MEKLKLLKKFFYLFLIAMQIIFFSPAHKALSIVPNNKDTWKLYLYYDTEDLKEQILQDPSFIRKWAYIAHMLGFGWCGGTKSPYVGDDFVFEKYLEKDYNGAWSQVYYLKGNYNSSHELSKELHADERLQMKISNVRLVIEPTTLKAKKPRIIETKFCTIASGFLENTSNRDDKISSSFIYTCNKSWSKSNNLKSNEKIGVKRKFTTVIFLSKNKDSRLSIEFDTEQGWEQSEGEIAMTEMVSIRSYDKIRAKSKRQIDLIGMVRKLEFPYTVRMYIEYDMTLIGILRGDGNAHVTHPTNRPTKYITFGGRNGMSATEDLLDMYNNRDIKGYSEWDWQWIYGNFGGKEIVGRHIEEFCRVKRGGELKGVFNISEGKQVAIKSYNSEPIDIITKDKDSSKENKVEVKDFKSFKTPGFNVQDLIINK